jgi:prevent-host-death family protein
MPTVLRVGARELKTRLGTYLNRVRRGERLIVTDRHQPVAELRRIEATPGSRAGRLARLAALGCITPPSRRLVPFPPIRVTGGPISETLLRNREERF